MVFLLPASDLHGADWYVSNTGNDSSIGTQQQPFLTVAHALSRSASGDRILLQRGGVFREGNLSVNENRMVQPYGNPGDAAPIISGSSVVTGLVPWSTDPRIYTVVVNPGESGVSQGFVNGEFATLARTPNQGWLRTEVGTQANRIVSSDLTAITGAIGYWSGGQVRWRKWSWWYETRPITASDETGTLTLGGVSAIPGLTGIDSGFFIDNTLRALDQPGEWYWDASENRLYVFPPEGVNPETMTIEVVVRSAGFFLDRGTLDGLVIQHFQEKGVEINRTATVRNCVIRHIGDTGIRGTWDCAGSTISGCTLEDVLNVGIAWIQNPANTEATLIERNVLQRIGNRNGLGGSGPWHAAGIIIYAANEAGNGVSIRYNRIRETGYAGVILGADHQTVERNVFRNCMNTLNDGAAIYTNCDRSILRENIILDTVGDMESAQPFYPLGHGIWPEFLENFRESDITGNTIYGSGGHGIFLPNNFSCTIRDNVLLSNRLSGMDLSARENSSTPQNHSITGNLMGIGARPWQQQRPENLADWAAPNDACLSYDFSTGVNMDFGAMSGSRFITQDGQDLVRNQSGTALSIAAWQSAEPDWADPSPLVRQGPAYLFINDSEDAILFPLPSGVEWQNIDGTPAGNATAINPYRSVVLVASGGSHDDLRGYYLFTELPANQPPDLAPIGSRSVVAGQSIEITLSASDPDGDSLIFSASAGNP